MSYTEKERKAAVAAYRAAAAKLFGANEVEQACYIRHPLEDTGQNSPEALCIIYLEADGRDKGDKFRIPDALGYWTHHGFENCIRLAEEAGIGFVEHINPAVAAVWD